MPLTRQKPPGSGRKKGSRNKIDKQATIYAATLRDQLSQDAFTFADKIIETWQDIKELEGTRAEESANGTPLWTKVDVIGLKLKFLGTISQYLYPKLGQVELKSDGHARFTPAVFQINIGPEEKAKRLVIAAERIKRDPALLTEQERLEFEQPPSYS